MYVYMHITYSKINKINEIFVEFMIRYNNKRAMCIYNRLTRKYKKNIYLLLQEKGRGGGSSYHYPRF